MERVLVPRTGVRYFLIPMAPPASPRNLLLMAWATVRSLVIHLRVRPRVTVATGGYASAPGALAAWLLRIPVVLFLPDVFPGKAVAFLAPLARKIAVTSEETRDHFPSGKAVVTGYPLRECFSQVTRGDGRRHFGFSANEIVLCVFGGSQGARHINEALVRILPSLLSRVSVLHICGEERLAEAERAAQRVPDELRGRYRLYPYLHDRDMAQALCAADLAVCRAGASVLGELTATSTPSILIPLPEVAVHQYENAEYLARRGAAVVLDDHDLDTRLLDTVADLLDHPTRLAEMTRAAAALARPRATDFIAALIAEVAA